MNIKGLELDRVFKPSSLALIGASRDQSKSGGMFLNSLLEGGFKGQIYPVTTNTQEIMGLKCYRSISDIPEEIDLAIITLPAQAVPQIIKECADKKVHFALIHSAGFGETGTEGKNIETDILAITRGRDIRAIGPNTMGIYCPQAGLNNILPWYCFPQEGGDVSFAGQSGWVCENFVLMGRERGLRLNKVIDSGNELDLTTTDFLEYFATDPETRIMAVYIEGVKDGTEFRRQIKEINLRKPVIILKGGRTAAGSRTAASHTGSLTGSNSAFEAALKQSGVTMAQDIEELIDFSLGFTCPYMPSGNRLGIITDAGGAAVAAADTCAREGLEVPETPQRIKKELIKTISKLTPFTSSLGNPIDFIWPPLDDRGIHLSLQCIELMSEFVDSLVIITFFLSIPDKELAARFIQQVEQIRDKIKKPIMLVPGHSTAQPDNLRAATLNRTPVFPTPERAVKAISTLVRRSDYLRETRNQH